MDSFIRNLYVVGASLNAHESFETLYNFWPSPLRQGYTGLKVIDPAKKVNSSVSVTPSRLKHLMVSYQIFGLYNVTAAAFGIRGFNNATNASLTMAEPSTGCSAISKDVRNKMVLVSGGNCTADVIANNVWKKRTLDNSLFDFELICSLLFCRFWREELWE